jgi:hypothetical protein
MAATSPGTPGTYSVRQARTIVIIASRANLNPQRRNFVRGSEFELGCGGRAQAA